MLELQPVKTQNRKEDTYSKTTKEKKKKVYLATHYFSHAVESRFGAEKRWNGMHGETRGG